MKSIDDSEPNNNDLIMEPTQVIEQKPKIITKGGSVKRINSEP